MKSYARPGGNVTGNSIYAGTEIFGKHIEILKALQSQISRLAVLWSYVPPIAHVGEGEMALDELSRAASGAGIVAIAAFAIGRRIPSMSDFAGAAFAAGLLVTYSANVPLLARQAAGFVDRILRGASPRDLPIERPSKFDLCST